MYYRNKEVAFSVVLIELVDYDWIKVSFEIE